MASLKLAANISFLFVKETTNLAERYLLAKEFGFHCVECSYPYVVPIEEIAEARQNVGLKHILINTFPGNLNDGEFGFAAQPGKTKEFQDSLELSIRYAKALDCKQIHIMSGANKSKFSFEQMEATYLANLEYGARRLHQEGILGLIEAINPTYTIKDYFMDSPSRAFEYIKKIGHHNLKMIFDVYHQQILEGNLADNAQKYWSEIGHIQIAQVPRRVEPMGDGEINYRYLLELFKKMNYSGYIGLEHNCTLQSTGESLEWIKQTDYEI